MADARVARIALVMVFERLAIMRIEDRMPVVLLRLDHAEAETRGTAESEPP